MAIISVPVYVRSATGRMTRRQHVERSLAAIIASGGVPLENGDRIMPQPHLLGRREETLAPLARRFGFPYSTDAEAVFRNPLPGAIYFEGSPTRLHYEGLKRAIDAGMHVYTEKPLALEVDECMDLVRRAESKGVCGGVVQDKRYLPGLAQAADLIAKGRLGRICHVLLDFGYFVHPDDGTRPDWNWDKDAGGGIILDMVAHWDYVLAHLVGRPTRVSAHSRRHITRRTRDGHPVPTTAEDSVYATFEVTTAVDEPVVCTTVSSWCRRPRRRGLLEIRIQGTEGAAEVYLNQCYWISNERTPVISWDPDTAGREEFDEGWEPYTKASVPANAFRHQWELFLRHVVDGSPNPASLLDGAQGVETSACTIASAARAGEFQRIRDVATLLDRT